MSQHVAKVADRKKNISMHKIPFFVKERPIKKKRRKEERGGSISSWRGERCGYRGRRFISRYRYKNIYTCLILDANCCCYFPLFIYECRTYFGIYLHMPFLSFLSVELVRMVRVYAISF